MVRTHIGAVRDISLPLRPERAYEKRLVVEPDKRPHNACSHFTFGNSCVGTNDARCDFPVSFGMRVFGHYGVVDYGHGAHMTSPLKATVAHERPVADIRRFVRTAEHCGVFDERNIVAYARLAQKRVDYALTVPYTAPSGYDSVADTRFLQVLFHETAVTVHGVTAGGDFPGSLYCHVCQGDELPAACFDPYGDLPAVAEERGRRTGDHACVEERRPFIHKVVVESPDVPYTATVGYHGVDDHAVHDPRRHLHGVADVHPGAPERSKKTRPQKTAVADIVGNEVRAYPQRAPLFRPVAELFERTDFVFAQLTHAFACRLPFFSCTSKPDDEITFVRIVAAGFGETPAHKPLSLPACIEDMGAFAPGPSREFRWTVLKPDRPVVYRKYRRLSARPLSAQDACCRAPSCNSLCV